MSGNAEAFVLLGDVQDMVDRLEPVSVHHELSAFAHYTNLVHSESNIYNSFSPQRFNFPISPILSTTSNIVAFLFHSEGAYTDASGRPSILTDTIF